jgi:hypothetical protein
MAWINQWTALIGVMLAAQLLLYLLYGRLQKSNKTIDTEEDIIMQK